MAQCTATTVLGPQCKNPALEGTTLCALHRGDQRERQGRRAALRTRTPEEATSQIDPAMVRLLEREEEAARRLRRRGMRPPP